MQCMQITDYPIGRRTPPLRLRHRLPNAAFQQSEQLCTPGRPHSTRHKATQRKHDTRARAHLAARDPCILLPPCADLDDNVRQLYAGAERAPQQKHTIATSQPAKHSGRIRHFVVAVTHGKAEEDGKRFGSDAVHRFVEHCIHP
eukprot:6467601-Prymnesium_polylepis.1